MFVPTKAFLSKGVGRHKEKLTSFEMATRDAHLANFNLVRVSSIFPPQCELVDREEGLSMMKPGQVVFAVIAESSTNEPSRLVAASIGVAMPADASHHGYISEHHSYGQNEITSGEYAEDLAASILVLSIAMVLGDVAVMGGIRGHRDADRRRHEPARLVGRGLGDHCEHHLPRFHHGQPFLTVHQLAMGRKDRAHAHEIEVGEMRIAQRHLEAGELFLVPADALGEKGLGGHKH